MSTHSVPETTPMPHTTTGADRVVRSPRRKRRQFEKWRVGVDEQLDPFPRQQLAPLAMPLDVTMAAAGNRQRLLLFHDGNTFEHSLPVQHEQFRRLVDFRLKHPQ